MDKNFQRGGAMQARGGLAPIKMGPTGCADLTLLQWMQQRYEKLDATELKKLFAQGAFVNSAGDALGADTPSELIRQGVYFYRPIADEVDTPIEVPVLAQTENWIAVDKPAGLATMPRGAFVARSVTVALRRQERNDEPVPAHRLDRPTAGVLLFTKRKQVRGAYQKLFEERKVQKSYRLLAPTASLPDSFSFEARIYRVDGQHRVGVAHTGEANSYTKFRRLSKRGNISLYEARPQTGKMHQIRAHMAALGAPLVGDRLYGWEGEQVPLQLLAHSLSFGDPFAKAVTLRSKQHLPLTEKRTALLRHL
ncbi:MAG: pseudouridine synthase [Winkia sp. UMB3164B]|nr:pseudouridine synthase [Winkia sp. UMB3164B]